MPNIKLITSKFSPYSHKVEMALIEKNIPYEKEVVDLTNRPEWFVKDAPLGKVPLLYVDNKVLFESSVICEYLEEAFPEKPLHSKDLVLKSQERAWMEFSNGLLASIFAVMFAQNQENLEDKKEELVHKIHILEKALSKKTGTFFGGEKLMLLDITMASVLKPLFFINTKFNLNLLKDCHETSSYVGKLVTNDLLKKVLPDNYSEIFKAFLTKKKSHLLTINSNF
ncbi:MAG: glutathione S-transferase family protein [Pelagibacterales bacterium]|nr:glutathione S-transferase family protein [Pelagibacterales bacterium]